MWKKAKHITASVQRNVWTALKASNEQGDAFARYDRHCLSLNQEEIEENLAGRKAFCYTSENAYTKAQQHLRMLFTATITVENSELDDQILIKSDGMPTYNFRKRS